MTDQLLTVKEAADFLDVHEMTLALWRKEERGPAFIRIERNVRYRRIDLDSYLDEQTVRPE